MEETEVRMVEHLHGIPQKGWRKEEAKARRNEPPGEDVKQSKNKTEEKAVSGEHWTVEGKKPVVILKRGESLHAAVKRVGRAGGKHWEYAEGLETRDLQHWEELRKSQLGFLKTGAFDDKVSLVERRRLISMATRYRIEARIELQHSRVMYWNCFEEYVPGPGDKPGIDTSDAHEWASRGRVESSVVGHRGVLAREASGVEWCQEQWHNGKRVG
jgi:hypothetical protein